jgi:hypothetical protein
MAKQKSILDKFTDTMKGLADSASQALKSEEPARVDESAAAYMPFAAEGMVSDPLPVPRPLRSSRRDESVRPVRRESAVPRNGREKPRLRTRPARLPLNRLAPGRRPQRVNCKENKPEGAQTDRR